MPTSPPPYADHQAASHGPLSASAPNHEQAAIVHPHTVTMIQVCKGMKFIDEVEVIIESVGMAVFARIKASFE